MVTSRLPPIAVGLALLVLAAPLGSARATDDASGPALLGHEVVSVRPHDPRAFTQGLLLDGDGALFESTGLLGRSSLREVDALDGRVLRLRPLPDDQFGEGLALVGDRLIQLTWQNGVATAWDAATFDPRMTYAYDGEGWGLCHDGTRLVMSDGSDRLTFRDPATFAVLGDVPVTLDDEPLAALNELECVDGAVWANVYTTDRIVRIDPASGSVTGTLDLTGIIEPHPDASRPGAVLNGIAYDPRADTFLVTGKLWPELFEIRVLEPDHATERPDAR
jgi:glutaminyl-peptide cyclotransferase